MLEPELTRNHWSTPEEPLVAEEFAPLDNLEGMPGALREAALGTRAPLEAHLEVDLGMQHPYMMNSCYSSGVINILYWIQIYKNQSNSSLQDGARTFKNEKFSNLLKDLGVGDGGVWKILSMLIAMYEKFVRKISINRKFFQKCLKRQHGMMMMVEGHSYQPSHGRRHGGNA